MSDPGSVEKDGITVLSWQVGSVGTIVTPLLVGRGGGGEFASFLPYF